MITQTPVYDSITLPVYSDGIPGAGIDAGTAPLTGDVPYHQVGRKILGFRVGAPEAFQGAPLHKNRRANTGTVMEAESLDIEDNTTGI